MRFMPNHLRSVLIPPLLERGPAYIVRVFDSHERTGRYHSRLLITLHRTGRDGKHEYPIFNLGDTWIGLPDSEREETYSDRAVRLAIECLCMQPGDTDEEFFQSYNETQREWSRSDDCEYMRMYAEERSDSDEEGSAPTWKDQPEDVRAGMMAAEYFDRQLSELPILTLD